MKLTKKTLIFVLLGLFIGGALIDIDHIFVFSGTTKEIIKCFWSGFLSLTSERSYECAAKRVTNIAILHDWRVGLLLFSFVLSYYVVLKNNEKPKMEILLEKRCLECGALNPKEARWCIGCKKRLNKE